MARPALGLDKGTFVRLTPTTTADLKKLAVERGLSVAALIRELIDEALAWRAIPSPADVEELSC